MSRPGLCGVSWFSQRNATKSHPRTVNLRSCLHFINACQREDNIKCVSFSLLKQSLSRQAHLGVTLFAVSVVPIFSGLSAAVIKEIQKVCRSLKSFSITTEQICKVDLFSALPSTLTQLSLCYCNISIEYFSTILSPGNSPWIIHIVQVPAVKFQIST